MNPQSRDASRTAGRRVSAPGRHSTLAAVLWAALAIAGASSAARADTTCDFLYRGRGLCSCAGKAAMPNADANFCPPSTAPCQIGLPRGFPCPRLPDDNPLTVEKIELGRFLFYDTHMSGEGLAAREGQACASCHQQGKAFTDGRAQAMGSTGDVHPRNSMSLANVAYAATLTWQNSELFRLEKQALTPMFGESPVELGLAGKEDDLLAYLRSERRYQRLFAEAFPGDADPVSLDAITQALASFERTLISGNSPRDRFEHSESAVRGDFLFNDETHECFHCHAGFNFQDSVDAQGKIAEVSFHNTGLYNLRCSDFGLSPLVLPWCANPPTPAACMRADSSRPLGCNCDGSGPQDTGCFPPPNTGIYDRINDPANMGKFKAPTLRNIAVTGPYMHDGSIADLDAVLDHYAAGGRTIADGPYAGDGSKSPTKDGTFVRGFALGDNDRADLLAFLESLTDEEFLTNPKFADPFQPVACAGDCDLNGGVEVNELVLDVAISLDTTSLARCISGDVNGDGAIAVDELVRAVRSALRGCA
jgi:cytochrome c peroxidase